MKTRFLASLVLVALLAVGAPSTASADGGPYPVNTDPISSIALHTATPNSPPPGANRWNCRPTASHPNPVVLVNGTMGNQSNNWTAVAPMLANEGWCVFTFNYGVPWWLPIAGGLGDIPTSAGELGRFVDKVRAATGAGEVDIVGHSQGGMMPNYYLKFLGGAAKVDRFVGLGADNHGSTVSGLANIARLWPIAPALWAIAPGASQQVAGSAFMKKLNSVPDTVPGVRYSVIATNRDIVVTPWRSAFLDGPGVRNITVQDVCPNDQVGHLGLPWDTGVITMVMNELDPVRRRPVVCVAGFPL